MIVRTQACKVDAKQFGCVINYVEDIASILLQSIILGEQQLYKSIEYKHCFCFFINNTQRTQVDDSHQHPAA